MINFRTKRIGFAFVAIMLMLLMFASRAVYAQDQRVFDEANLFSQDEITSLQSAIDAFKSEHNMDLVVLTIDDAQGKSPIESADDFYDENGFGIGDDYSGALLLIDMDNREPAISTSGNMIDYISDDRLAAIFDDVYEGLYDEDFNAAASSFVESTDGFVTEGYPQDAHRYDSATGEITRPVEAKEPGLGLLDGLIAASSSAASGAAGVFGVKRKYALKNNTHKYSYQANSNFNLGVVADNLINERVTQRIIPVIRPGDGDGPSSGGGGRSSTHTSSSGRTHGGGGGGRKF